MKYATTIAVAIVAGIAVALVVRSELATRARESALLDAITAEDPDLRRSGWAAIPEESDIERRTGIVERMRTAGPGAQADAGRAFLDRGWRPDLETDRIELATAAARAGDSAPLLVWFDAAWTSDPGALERWSDGLATVLDDAGSTPWSVSDRFLDGLFESPTDGRLEAIERWRWDRNATRSTRVDAALDLTLGLHGRTPRTVTDDATAMQAVLARNLDDDPAGDESLALVPAWLLATRADRRSRTTLESRSAAGDDAARLALALQDPEAVRRVNRAVLLDEDELIDRRLIAAGRVASLGPLDARDEATIRSLLETNPADTRGTVHAAAMIAHRSFDEATRADLRRRWSTSEAAAPRRAAILLAALEVTTGDLDPGSEAIATVRSAAEDPAVEPAVRRIARLGLRAMDAWSVDELDPADYAARTAHLPDGGLDPDAVMLGILAADADVLRRLTTPPDLPDGPLDESTTRAWAAEIAWRVNLVRGLRPEWWRTAGEPVPDSIRSLRRWIDLLDACRRYDLGFATTDRPGEDERP